LRAQFRNEALGTASEGLFYSRIDIVYKSGVAPPSADDRLTEPDETFTRRVCAVLLADVNQLRNISKPVHAYLIAPRELLGAQGPQRLTGVRVCVDHGLCADAGGMHDARLGERVREERRVAGLSSSQRRREAGRSWTAAKP
jgi:hypothetical protein